MAPKEKEADKKNDQNPIKNHLGRVMQCIHHQRKKKTKTKKKGKRNVTENSKARGKRMASLKREDPLGQEKRRNKNLHLVFRGLQQQLAKLNLIAVVAHI